MFGPLPYGMRVRESHVTPAIATAFVALLSHGTIPPAKQAE